MSRVVRVVCWSVTRRCGHVEVYYGISRQRAVEKSKTVCDMCLTHRKQKAKR